MTEFNTKLCRRLFHTKQQRCICESQNIETDERSKSLSKNDGSVEAVKIEAMSLLRNAQQVSNRQSQASGRSEHGISETVIYRKPASEMTIEHARWEWADSSEVWATLWRPQRWLNESWLHLRLRRLSKWMYMSRCHGGLACQCCQANRITKQCVTGSGRVPVCKYSPLNSMYKYNTIVGLYLLSEQWTTVNEFIDNRLQIEIIQLVWTEWTSRYAMRSDLFWVIVSWCISES